MRLMDDAASIWQKERAAGEPLHFSISGGEPFLEFARLQRLTMHGSSLGAVVGCVTNGSWATNDGVARSKLAALKASGLSLLAVSTSRFHQQFVKRERVDRALRVAGEVGLRTALKCAVTATDAESDRLEDWVSSRNADQRETFPVLPYVRSGVSLPEVEYVRTEGLPTGRCPGASLTVREDGCAYTCCMPGAFTDFHSLGAVIETGLGPAFERFCTNGIQQVLRNEGPSYFACAIVKAGEGKRLRTHYEGVCDLCAHLGSDATMSAIARRIARRYALRQIAGAAWSLVLKSLRTAVSFNKGGTHQC